jgi:hypothetical protein
MAPIAKAETVIRDYDAARKRLDDALGEAIRVCAEEAARWQARAAEREAKSKETTS